MATGVEHRVEILGRDLIQTIGVGQQRLRLAIAVEALGRLGLGVRLVALRVERRLTALGRSQYHLRAGIQKGGVRRGEFLQPEAGLFAGVTQLVVGREHDENFHGASLLKRDVNSSDCRHGHIAPLPNHIHEKGRRSALE